MNMLYEPAIHFQQVHFSVNDKMILKSITGSFPKGQITTLVGPLALVKQHYLNYVMAFSHHQMGIYSSIINLFLHMIQQL